MKTALWAIDLMLAKAATETGEKSKIYCYKAMEAKELFMDKRQSFQKMKLLVIDLLCTWIKDTRECISPGLVEKLHNVHHLKYVVGSEDGFIWCSDGELMSSVDDNDSNGE
jgi:hypothetical protein